MVDWALKLTRTPGSMRREDLDTLREAGLDDRAILDLAMIVGYYDQSLISVEPMITRAKFEERQSFALDIPTVPDAGVGTMWPVGFEAEYDAEAQAYRFVFRVAGEE